MRKHKRNTIPQHTCAIVDRTTCILRSIDIKLLWFPILVDNFKLSPSKIQEERCSIDNIEFSNTFNFDTLIVKLDEQMDESIGPNSLYIAPAIAMMLLSGEFVDTDHSYTTMRAIATCDSHVCATNAGYTFPMLAERIIAAAREIVPYRIGDTTQLSATLLITYEPANAEDCSRLVLRASGNVLIHHCNTGYSKETKDGNVPTRV